MAPGIHFSTADLAGIRIARTASAMVETIFSLRRLDPQMPSQTLQGIEFRAWATGLRAQVGKWLRPVTGLAPYAGGGVDLFRVTSMDMNEDLTGPVEALLAAPAPTYEAELQTTSRPVPPEARRLPTDNQARQAVTTALRRYHRVAIADHWDAIHSVTAARRRTLADLLAYGGVDALLANLDPGLRWRRPVLEIRARHDGYTPPVMRLNGRGLVIVPSAFARGVWILSPPADSDLPWHLVLSVTSSLTEQSAFWSLAGMRTRPLADLIGRTRANLLHEVALGGNTSQIAGRAGISVSSASMHAAVLRATGLIRSEREGTQVKHQLTELGRELLD